MMKKLARPKKKTEAPTERADLLWPAGAAPTIGLELGLVLELDDEEKGSAEKTLTNLTNFQSLQVLVLILKFRGI